MSDPATQTQPQDSSAQLAEAESPMAQAVRMEVDRIRPLIQMDGGDIHFVSVDDESGVVQVELSGACVGCPASSMTLKAGVERILKDRVPGVTEVNAEGVEV